MTDASPAPDRTAPAVDGRHARWEEHRLTKRRELVDATVRAIRSRGATIGMDEIAAQAGTSKTVFYRHFTDRAGLYAAVAERVDATIIRDLTRAAGSDAALGGPHDLIHGVIAAYLHLVDEDPQLYRFIVNAPIVPAGERPAGDVAAGMTDRIAAQVADLLRTGFGELCDERTARTWGVALVGMVRACADAWLAQGGTSSGLDADRLADDLTALAWGGLSALTTGPEGGSH